MVENTESTSAEFVLSLQATEIEDDGQLGMTITPGFSGGSCGAMSC